MTSSFFEPAPPPREPEYPRWFPPAWDRPSEGTVPWKLAVNAIVHRGEGAVILLDSLDVYPNGFVINLAIHVNPHRRHEAMSAVRRPGARMPRVGVRFSDGRTAGRDWAGIGFGLRDVPKDENGFPTEPILGGTGGGGGGYLWRFGTWVYPLPPAGPVEIFVSLPVADLDEGKAVVDGGEIRAAAERATVVWQ